MNRVGYLLFGTGLVIGIVIGSLGLPTVFPEDGQSIHEQRLNQSQTVIPTLVEQTYTQPFRPDEIQIQQGLSLTGQTDGRTDLYVWNRSAYLATHWRVGGMHNWAGVLFQENSSAVVDRRYYTHVPVPGLNNGTDIEWSRLLQNVFVQQIEDDRLLCEERNRPEGEVYECRWYEQEDDIAQGIVYRHNPQEGTVTIVGCERPASSPLYNTQSCLLGPGGVL